MNTEGQSSRREAEESGQRKRTRNKHGGVLNAS